MSFWARVKPDQLGRPSHLLFSADAAKILEGRRVTATLSNDLKTLSITTSLEGRPINKQKMFPIRGLLDEANSQQQLKSEPFALRRQQMPAPEVKLVGDIYAYDPSLRANAMRRDAMPMAPSSQTRITSVGYSLEDLTTIYGLAAIIAGRTISEDERRSSTDPFIEQLPAPDTIVNRFDSWLRFEAFVEYRLAVLEKRRLTDDQAKDELAELLERGE